MLSLIDTSEQTPGTALLTAVKRAEEQAFALASGQNPMFCENAARRLHSTLREQAAYVAIASPAGLAQTRQAFTQQLT